jgi:hypothetical protein
VGCFIIQISERVDGPVQGGRNNDCMTRKFAAFCKAKQYAYPDFTEKVVMHFVEQMDKDGGTMATCHRSSPPALALVGGEVSVEAGQQFH